MTITNIIGGLGNQMFQYAAGKALSLEHGTRLRLDITGFETYGLHQGFELQRVFNCTTEIASVGDIQNVLGWQSSPLVKRVMAKPRLAAFRSKAFVVEPHFHYWPEINSLQNDCYLLGYWQSEQYFAHIAHKIREDFTFKQPMSKKNTEFAKQINLVNAVSLHVRRGDYANNPKTTATHGLCSLEYYQKAIECIAGLVQQPYFYIFSDDIAWVKCNINMDFPHEYIDYNHGTESYNDMRLMSICKHNIIANSSFSWWGAWLNSNIEKIVIAPKHWFAREVNTVDLIPRGWLIK
ncbi:MAG: alpha-1,2-fucosyltransferase [Methylotenera sp.]|nr:alpha-1,2-fucosyltransferase [Methylotenera sp.]